VTNGALQIVLFTYFLVGEACSVIGGLDGLLQTILTCTLQSAQYVSTVSRFDLIILVCIASSVCMSVCLLHIYRMDISVVV